MAILMLANWVTVGICFNMNTFGQLDAFHRWWPVMFAGMYLPALAMVLVPVWQGGALTHGQPIVDGDAVPVVGEQGKY